MAPRVPVVSVVIPAHNAAATLGDALRSLAEQDCAEPFEVLVVDDHSTDATARIVREAELPVRVVRPAGRGAAVARNSGAAEAQAEALAFVDADCVPDPGWLRAGIAALASADLVQGRVEPVRPLEGPFERSLEVLGPRGLFESANWFVRRRLFERVGGFEQWIGTAEERPFGEDTDFGWRARRAGARIAFSHEAVARHAVFAGDWKALMNERWRLRYFPALARRVPELRSVLTWRVFLSTRTRRFDLALLGLALGARRSRRPLLLLAYPYLRLIHDLAEPWGRRREPAVFITHFAGDCLGLIALLQGSIRHRAVIL